tara:strand:+ start:82 stop:477 length:396 start_codon:yes stop_codon:yes gene_type:complete
LNQNAQTVSGFHLDSNIVYASALSSRFFDYEIFALDRWLAFAKTYPPNKHTPKYYDIAWEKQGNHVHLPNTWAFGDIVYESFCLHSVFAKNGYAVSFPDHQNEYNPWETYTYNLPDCSTLSCLDTILNLCM